MILPLNRAAVAICLGLLLVACKGSSSSPGGSFYEPFSSFAGPNWTGLWLVSSSDPAAAPIQVTAGSVDIPDTGATFYDWTYSASSGTRDGLTPRFFVYGHNGHLFGISLSQPGSQVQLSNGTYLQLCALSAAQAGPFSSAKSFVIAQVELATSSPTRVCDTTWIIPTDAGNGSAPASTSSLLQLLGGLKDTSTGLVTAFLVSTDDELDLYSASDMTRKSTLLSGLAGNAIVPLSGGSMTDTQAVAVEAPDGGTSLAPLPASVYLVDSKGAKLVQTYSISVFASCTVVGELVHVFGTVIGSSLLYSVADVPSGFGYTVYSVPLSGGTPTAVYSNTTGCPENIAGSTAGRLIVKQFNGTNGFDNISLDPIGPANQTPVSLITVNVADHIADVYYLVGGDAWFQDIELDPVTHQVIDITSSVIDVSNGHILKTYAHSLIGGDFWKGVNADGSLDRGPVLIDAGTPGPGCDGLLLSSIEAVDPASFASNLISISNAPCKTQGATFGPTPLAIGPIGSSMYSLSNPSGNQLQLTQFKLVAPNNGSFQAVFELSPY